MQTVAHRRNSQVLLGVIFLICASFSSLGSAFAAPRSESGIERSLNKIVSSNKWNIGVSVVDLESGGAVAHHNGATAMKPASVMKVATSGALLSELGPEWRFKTEVFASGNHGQKSRVLYVRGGGDPSLAIESVWQLARQVRMAGISKVDRLVLDDSLFSGTRAPKGARAYQTGTSALSFNYNSLGIVVCPSTMGQRAIVSLEPWEFGVTAKGDVKTVAGKTYAFSISPLSKGLSYTVKGSIGAGRGCVTYYRAVDEPVAYFGTTFLGLLSSVGIAVPKRFELGVVPEDASELFVHDSKPIKSIVEDLNHFSNNFIGEQLVFLLGDTRRDSDPLGMAGRYRYSVGIERIAQYLRNLGCREQEFVVVDGSGLSHANRLSPNVITTILRKLDKDDSVRPEFESSLSVASKSGTLKTRDFRPDGIVLRGKTGTLNGVSSLAGYLFTRDGKKLAFAILQNDIPSKDKAMAVEEEIVALLHREG